jgi:hypothetical protein
MGRSILLWLLGVPIPIIILIRPPLRRIEESNLSVSSWKSPQLAANRFHTSKAR